MSSVETKTKEASPPSTEEQNKKSFEIVNAAGFISTWFDAMAKYHPEETLDIDDLEQTLLDVLKFVRTWKAMKARSKPIPPAEL